MRPQMFSKGELWCIVAFIVLTLVCMMLGGCGSKREETQHRDETSKTVSVEQTKTERNAYAPNGAPYVETILTTKTLDQTTRAEADTRINSMTTLVAPEIAATARIVLGAAAGATPWGGVTTIAGLLTTAATGAFAVMKSMSATRAQTERDAEKRRADEHKADAEEGWSRAEANALKVPPESAP